ncbi:hypothetical protein CROQUDRAFT_21026, partial [Cronartium quercuum f. sp. fusiforme G11]
DLNIDSGCSKSMTPHWHHLSNIRSKEGTVHLVDDSTIPSSHVRMMALPLQSSPKHNMMLVLDFNQPLLLVAELCDNGIVMIITKTGCLIIKQTDFEASQFSSPVEKGERCGNLYYFPS